MDLIMEKLREANLKDVYVVTNNKFYKDFSEWGKKYKNVKIVNDNTNNNEDRLGAYGDFKFVVDKEKINDDVMIINSDNILLFSLKPVIEKFNNMDTDLLVLYDVKTKEEASKMGIAEIDKEGNLVFFEEKPQNPRTTLVSIGVYLYKRETLKLLEQYKKEGGKMEGPGFFNAWLTKFKKVNSYIVEGDDKWFDIGTKEIYDYVCKLVKQ